MARVVVSMVNLGPMVSQQCQWKREALTLVAKQDELAKQLCEVEKQLKVLMGALTPLETMLIETGNLRKEDRYNGGSEELPF